METQVVEEFEIIKSTLKNRFDIKRIFVFGSYAFSNPDQQSDIDLCIIVDLKNKRKIEVIRDIRRRLSRLISRPLDILVYSETEFNERARLANTMEHEILSQGKVLYP